MQHECVTVATLPVVLAMPDVTHNPISDSGDLRRKRKGKYFGSSLGPSCDEMWAMFHWFMASFSAAGHSSTLSHFRLPRGHCPTSPANHSRPSPPSSCTACQWLPRKDWPASPARSTKHDCMAHLWWSSWLARFTCLTSPARLNCLFNLTHLTCLYNCPLSAQLYRSALPACSGWPTSSRLFQSRSSNWASALVCASHSRSPDRMVTHLIQWDSLLLIDVALLGILLRSTPGLVVDHEVLLSFRWVLYYIVIYGLIFWFLTL